MLRLFLQESSGQRHLSCVTFSWIPFYWRAGASQPSRTSGSDFSIYMGAAHTVIPIQRQHAHKIATSVYSTVESVQSSQCTRNRYRRKMRHVSESAEEEETRLSRRQSRDRAKRAVQSSQATKNCRGSETAEARERTDRDRRKSRLDSESAKEKDTRYR